jgi:S-adenosylmethionine:tRNA ribosyltransferase-isomerase
MAIKLSSFAFTLPQKLIASYPTESREDARLMVVHRKNGKIEHKKFEDLLSYFQEGDTIIVNDTRVLPAKLYGSKDKTGAQIEVILLRPLESGENLWDAIVEPARKIRVGNKLYFADNALVAEVLDNTTSRGRTLKFLFEGTKEEFYTIIEQIGMIPLPPQIKRKPEEQDKERYQTVYAKNIGAVVAPAAGFHFTPFVIKQLHLKNVHFVPITLHINVYTLNFVDVEDLTKYKVGSEYFMIPPSTVQVVNQSLDLNHRVCAVGISTLKALESAVSVSRRLKPAQGWTNKFIFPPYDFEIANTLVTNFHLPESLALINAAAFVGFELMQEVYAEAIKEKYRFFVYGDAMLVL